MDQSEREPNVDPEREVPVGSIAGWTGVGAISLFVVYRMANDVVAGRASLGETVGGVAALLVVALALWRLARCLSA